MGSAKNNGNGGFAIPWAGVIWLIVTVVVFLVGLREVTLRDRERFPDDFELTTQPADGENSVDMQIVGGTFRYNEVAQQSNPVETGTFGPESGNAVADFLFENIPDVTEVTIESQTILVTYDNDIEADLMLRRAQRPVINSVLNEGDVITGEVDGEAEMTLRFTSTEELRFGAFIASLIPEGSEEVYNSREEGENGSELSRFLFTEVTSLEGATIRPDGMTITYRDGGVEQRVVTRVQEALDDYHPRASLQPALWVMTIGPSADTILSIVPIDTGLPLFLFTLAYAVLEIAFFFVFRNSDDKLVRPLVRVAAIFLFFWSLYGHEPLWDYILGIIFPTSAQLVHPNATVIEFTAQHLELVFVSSLITVPAGLLFGILVTRDEFRDVLPLVNNIVNSGQTVPTIAIVAFMAPIIGFGFWPAIIALVAYGLLPVVRNTIAGLEAVPASVIDSARGMGMTPGQILFQIELPIASSVIMAGIRTSMVINVGTATLGAFVGSGGLGTPIASGLSMTIDAFILLGAIPAALLAILIDYVLGRIEFVITPRGLQIEG